MEVVLGIPNVQGWERLIGKPAAPASSAADRYGFRRVERVSIRIGHAGTVATVTGVAHRCPRTVRVPLTVAHSLIASGAPFDIDRAEPPHPKLGV